MPYNTKALLLDVNGKPIPQYFNPTTDEFEEITGAGGSVDNSLTGSSAPLNAVAWKTIYTVTAAQMPSANSSYYPTVSTVVTPNARKRFFRVTNALNQAWSLSFFVSDSAGAGGEAAVNGSGTVTILANTQNQYFDSDSLPQLGAAGDSLKLVITSGATAATSGEWLLYVREVF